MEGDDGERHDAELAAECRDGFADPQESKGACLEQAWQLDP
jgi:hypothetical protein